MKSMNARRTAVAMGLIQQAIGELEGGKAFAYQRGY
jgi:hypothetical protein